jgi:hypothetical protein
MTKVSDLSADQAASLARAIVYDEADRQNAAKLLYYALGKDERSTEATHGLLMWLWMGIAPKEIRLAVLQHVLEVAQDQTVREQIMRVRQIELSRAGLLLHISGDANTTADVWDQASEFTVNEPALQAILEEVLNRYKTLHAAFRAFHLCLGVEAGLLRHKQLGKVPLENFDEYAFPDRFEHTEQYLSFLEAEKLMCDKPQ